VCSAAMGLRVENYCASCRRLRGFLLRWRCLLQRRERRPELGGKQFGLLPCREVTALIDFVKVGEAGIGAPHPGLRRSVGIFSEYGDGHGQ
jgi:hypothetical protein